MAGGEQPRQRTAKLRRARATAYHSQLCEVLGVEGVLAVLLDQRGGGLAHRTRRIDGGRLRRRKGELLGEFEIRSTRLETEGVDGSGRLCSDLRCHFDTLRVGFPGESRQRGAVVDSGEGAVGEAVRGSLLHGCQLGEATRVVERRAGLLAGRRRARESGNTVQPSPELNASHGQLAAITAVETEAVSQREGVSAVKRASGRRKAEKEREREGARARAGEIQRAPLLSGSAQRRRQGGSAC